MHLQWRIDNAQFSTPSCAYSQCAPVHVCEQRNGRPCLGGGRGSSLLLLKLDSSRPRNSCCTSPLHMPPSAALLGAAPCESCMVSRGCWPCNTAVRAQYCSLHAAHAHRHGSPNVQDDSPGPGPYSSWSTAHGQVPVQMPPRGDDTAHSSWCADWCCVFTTLDFGLT